MHAWGKGPVIMSWERDGNAIGSNVGRMAVG